LNAPHSKCGIPIVVSGVRIPPSPQNYVPVNNGGASVRRPFFSIIHSIYGSVHKLKGQTERLSLKKIICPLPIASGHVPPSPKENIII
jgi:hypothetical protein